MLTISIFFGCFVIGFVISCGWRNTVSNNLAVECVYQQRPLPLLTLVLEDCHIRHNNLKGVFVLCPVVENAT